MKKIFALTALLLMAGHAAAQQEEAGFDSEKYRPQVHFSPENGWMSDPNGLVYFDGEYHLFYQHLPPGPGARMNHWGHAVSSDLVHWEHLPIALYPDSLGYIYSGSCVADIENTSGLGTAENPPLLAIFTYYDPAAAAAGKVETQSQGLAYSTDRGRTWTKYAGNPVMPSPTGAADFRDPKVIWDEARGHWLMALTGGPCIKFYTSPDCIHWSYLSEFGHDRGSHVGPLECPDFFPLRVEGTGETKWVLIASVVDFTDTPDRLATATQYFIGDFDGREFTSEQRDTLWIDYGKDNYAGVTFADAPSGRRIFAGWMHSHQYAWQAMDVMSKTWSGAATVPRDLGIVRDGGGYRLTVRPVPEFDKLRKKEVKIGRMKISGSMEIGGFAAPGSPLDIRLEFSTKNLPAGYGLRLSNPMGEYISFRYDQQAGEFRTDRTRATGIVFHPRFATMERAAFTPSEKEMEWRLITDAMSTELFVGEWKIVFTNVVYPTVPFDRIEIFSEEGEIVLNRGSIAELEPIL